MKKNTTQLILSQMESSKDALMQIIREGARELIFKTVLNEFDCFMSKYDTELLNDGRKAVVRKGYLPTRTI